MQLSLTIKSVSLKLQLLVTESGKRNIFIEPIKKFRKKLPATFIIFRYFIISSFQMNNIEAFLD